MMITTQYSDIVLGKVDASDAGFNFKEIEITLTADHVAGAVVTATGALAAADGTDAFGVLVDRALLPDSTGRVNLAEPLTVGETYRLVVAVRGVTFAKEHLVIAGGTAAPEAVLEALEARGNKVQE
nr:MAG TPA: Head decoration protein [Caudoviricetes sp.]